MSDYYAAIEHTRKLASIVVVDDVIKHPNADSLELAIIGGWQCVVKIGEFSKGDKAIYFEIDSLLPVDNPLFSFLKERSAVTYDNVTYGRIKSIKLRSELSQGLLLPVPDKFQHLSVGTNLTNELGIRKREELVKTSTEGLDGKLGNDKFGNTFMGKLIKLIAGKAAPSLEQPWPSFLTKSDQERVQNIGKQYAQAQSNDESFEITTKMDGSSLTIFTHLDNNNVVRVGQCSRNYQLISKDIVFTWVEATRRYIAMLMINMLSGYNKFKRVVETIVKDPANRNKEYILTALKDKYIYFPKFVKVISFMNNDFMRFVEESRIKDKLMDYHTKTGRLITLQGEICGPNFNRNFEKLNGTRYFVYQVYEDGNKPLLPKEARQIVKELDLEYVPVLNEDAKLPASVKDCLKLADGPGTFNPKGFREGVVFKSNTRNFSFKVISNKYLLKQND